MVFLNLFSPTLSVRCYSVYLVSGISSILGWRSAQTVSADQSWGIRCKCMCVLGVYLWRVQCRGLVGLLSSFWMFNCVQLRAVPKLLILSGPPWRIAEGCVWERHRIREGVSSFLSLWIIKSLCSSHWNRASLRQPVCREFTPNEADLKTWSRTMCSIKGN